MVETVTIPASNSGPTLEEQAAAQEAAAKEKENSTPALEGEEAGQGERPKWLPEKFETVEDMAKAYAELEKKNSAGEAEGKTEGETEEAAEKAVENAGLDMDALSAEYATNGELTQESLDALAAVGITKDMVDTYIAGQTAATESAQAEMLEPIGGDIEKYNEMIEWAADGMSETEIDNFNKVLSTGNDAAIKLAVKNLAEKYTEANGAEPQGALEGGRPNSGSSKYESTAQLMKDMNNPAYAKDPAFRAKVAAKLERSDIL